MINVSQNKKHDMTTKKDEAITDSVRSLEEMADLVLTQLTLLEKFMSLNDQTEIE